MIVRIRLGTGRRVARKRGKNRHMALACGALLTPMSLMAYVVGFWRLASDMGLLPSSGINGFFGHWQVAVAAGAALHLGSYMMNRYGRQGEFEVPEVLKVKMLPLQTDEAPRSRVHSG